MEMRPVLLIPRFKEGGGSGRLKSLYNKDCPDQAFESRELSCQNDLQCRVGTLSGPQALWDLMKGQERKERLGSDWSGEGFPLLVKLIDAAELTPVILHPDEAYARTYEDKGGNTKFWYIAQAEPEAFIYRGFNRPVSRQEVAEAAKEGTLCELLHREPVKAGDSFLMKAGTVHAACGCVIAEIGQNSELFYRLFDYGRTDQNGNTLPLDIEKAVEAMLPDQSKIYFSAGHLIKTEHFTIDRFFGSTGFEVEEKSFCHLLCLEGEGELAWSEGSVAVKKGRSFFIPAGLGKCRMSGSASGLLIGL